MLLTVVVCIHVHSPRLLCTFSRAQEHAPGIHKSQNLALQSAYDPLHSTTLLIDPSIFILSTVLFFWIGYYWKQKRRSLAREGANERANETVKCNLYEYEERLI